MSRLYLFLLSLFVFVIYACSVDSEITEDLLLSCTEEGQCPEGWKCFVEKKKCLPPGKETEEKKDAGDDDDNDASDDEWKTEPRAEDKESVCIAIYDKAQECEDDILRILGEAASEEFAKKKSEFVYYTCITRLLKKADDARMDDLVEQIPLIPVAPCSTFASELCEMFPEEEGYNTKCR